MLSVSHESASSKSGLDPKPGGSRGETFRAPKPGSKLSSTTCLLYDLG